MAIVLYEHFVHLTRIILHHNIPFLSATENSVFISPFWSLAGLIPFASDTVTRWVIFLRKTKMTDKHAAEGSNAAYLGIN